VSKILSLKLKEAVFQDAENILKDLKIPRNTYINEAVALFNRLHERKDLKKRILQESKLVQADSIRILEELEALEDGEIK